MSFELGDSVRHISGSGVEMIITELKDEKAYCLIRGRYPVTVSYSLDCLVLSIDYEEEEEDGDEEDEEEEDLSEWQTDADWWKK